jgi:predicted nucleotidyltransferase
MAGARWELVRRLRDLLARWKSPILHASLFGSVARGEGNAASDIDVLVVRPKGIDAEDEQWRSQLEELADRVLRWTGNQAGIAELSEDDVAATADHPPIFEEVAEEAIDLGGLPLRRLTKKS